MPQHSLCISFVLLVILSLMLANHPSNYQNIALLKLQVSLQDCSPWLQSSLFIGLTILPLFSTKHVQRLVAESISVHMHWSIGLISSQFLLVSAVAVVLAVLGFPYTQLCQGSMVYCNDPSPLVLSQDLIRGIYRFHHTCTLKAICAGVGFGSGTETTSPQALNWVKWLLTINSRPPHITVDLCRNFHSENFFVVCVNYKIKTQNTVESGYYTHALNGITVK